MDAQYEESLRQDQEREAAELAAAAAARQAARAEEGERRRREEAAAAAAERRAREREALEPEPQPGTPGVATICVVLPNGTRMTRRFRADSPMWAVFAWLRSLEELAPFRAWEPVAPAGHAVDGPLYESGETLEELKLAPSALLRLRVEEEEE